MDILIQIGLLILGFVLLIKGAGWFVDGAAGIAEKFKIPQLVIGLTIVAMGTSAPEAAISITGAINGAADIAVGNVFGSNILNILIILGLAGTITTIAVQKSTLFIELPFMIGISIMLLFMGINDNVVNLFEGIILVILFIIYLIYLFIVAKKNGDKKEKQTEEFEIEDAPEEKTVLELILLAIFGGVIIVVGSNITVDAATKIAEFIGLSERIIGLTIVALGTSLPELVTSVTAAKKGNADIAIGNIVGSNIFNILFVIGISALIIPITFASNFIIDAIIAIAAGILLLIATIRKKKLTRFWSIIMLIGYAAYLVYMLIG